MRPFLAACLLLAACKSSSDEQGDEMFAPPVPEKPVEFPPDWPARVEIPAHLARLGEEEEAFVVKSVLALQSIDFRTYSAAASGLAALGEAATPYLGYIGETSTPSERMFRIVTVVLAPILKQLDSERLALHLPSHYRASRATAAQVVGERDLMEHATTLVSLLEDPDLQVRRAAIFALRRLTNRFYGYNPEAAAARRTKPVARWRDLLGSG